MTTKTSTASVAGAKYFYAAGRRKTSVAKVRLYPEGKGDVTVNGRTFIDYFPLIQLRSVSMSPLRKVEMRKQFDITVVVSGGGVRGQSEAMRHGIARALLVFDASLRGVLKEAGYLTRDQRAKERKKYGLKRARRAPQFSKR